MDRLTLDNPIPLILLAPTYEKVSGVTKKTYPSIDEGVVLFGNFKTYGGTERDVNGVYSVEDTAVIGMWFDPIVKSDCRIALESGEVYDILGEPEDINRRHQFLKFKVRRIKS